MRSPLASPPSVNAIPSSSPLRTGFVEENSAAPQLHTGGPRRSSPSSGLFHFISSRQISKKRVIAPRSETMFNSRQHRPGGRSISGSGSDFISVTESFSHFRSPSSCPAESLRERCAEPRNGIPIHGAFGLFPRSVPSGAIRTSGLIFRFAGNRLCSIHASASACEAYSRNTSFSERGRRKSFISSMRP